MLAPIWVRRVLIGPAVVALAILAVASAPLVLLGLLVVSPWLPGRWRPLRFGWFALLYLLMDASMLIAAFALWVASGFGLLRSASWYQRAHYDLLGLALRILEAEARRVLNVRIVVDGATPDETSNRPLVVLARHAGAGDSFLIAAVLINHYHREFRIVLKEALQWDPALDVLLNRIPTHFVGKKGGSNQIDMVSALATGLDDDDAFVIFPEGGNFTAGRRLRSIEFLRERGLLKRASQAEQMSNVLAPREAGTIAALTAAPDADVLIVAHTGLEHLNSLKAVWRYMPMDTEIRMHWWQVPDEEVPRDPAGISAWLYGWWRIVDTWIEEHEPEVVSAAQADPTTRTEPRTP